MDKKAKQPCNKLYIVTQYQNETSKFDMNNFPVYCYYFIYVYCNQCYHRLYIKFCRMLSHAIKEMNSS